MGARLARELDRAVLDAYGLAADVDEQTILAHVLALNAARAGSSATKNHKQGGGPEPQLILN